MKIEKCTKVDLDVIMGLYDIATSFQHTKNIRNTWHGFDRDEVIQTINDGNLYKILEEDVVACVFITVFDDPLLWAEKNNDAAVYLHRIATHTDFRGRYYVKDIIRYCTIELREKSTIEYIRMDTHFGNPQLNKYYEKCGFEIVGKAFTKDVPELPEHYQNESFTLFEIKL